MASPLCRFLARACFALAAFLSLAAFPLGAAPDQGQPLRQPVLVELFTSEGCSDCPPADALLAAIDQQQFVPGAEAIVLSEHVTYWNHQGWRDPFSIDSMDARQQKYAREFGLDSIYTPQMVVDGAQQFVGSDASHLKAAVQKEAAKPKLAIQIEKPRIATDGAVSF